MRQLGIIGAFLLLSLAPTVHAATITVDTTAMVIDPADGACSLPEAIEASNTDTPSGTIPGECPAGMMADTVILQPGATYLLTHPFGLEGLDVVDTLTVIGSGATVARDPNARHAFGLFRVTRVQLTLEDPVITGGSNRGVAVLGDLVVKDCLFRDNFRGIIGYSGSVTITNSTFRDNYTGGVSVSRGRLTIEGSTISNNGSTGVYSGSSLLISNSTISGNGHPDGIQQFGAIIALGFGANRLDNVTVVGNSGSLAGGTYGRRLRVKNSIIAGNLVPDCYGDVRSLGNNIFGLGSGCMTSTTDIEVEPTTILGQVLGPLLPNGGPTYTHALLENSPGIDAASCIGYLGEPVQYDQRGVARPQDGNGDGVAACDIGAYELATSPPEPRGMGFWKHQCSDQGFHQVSADELNALFSEVEVESSAFIECAAIGCGVFHTDGPQNEMRPKAVRQLLAVWLNATSDRLPLETDIDLSGLTSATTVSEAIDEVEATICDPSAGRADLELAKDIAEALNLGGEDMDLAIDNSLLNIQPGGQKWVTLALINMSTYPRSYDVSAAGPWSVQLSHSRVNGLAPGGIALITLSAIAPAFAPPGTAADVNVVAEDRHSDTSLRRELSLTFKVAGAGGGGGSKRMLPPD